MHVYLLSINGCLLPLFVRLWSVKLEYLLVQPHGQSFGEGFNCLGYVKPISGCSDCFLELHDVGVDVFPFHFDAFTEEGLGLLFC